MKARKKLYWDVAIELYKEGKADSEIAEEVGVCRDTVKSWRNRNHLLANGERKKKERALTQLEIDCIEAHKHNMSYAQWKTCGEKGYRYG